MNRAATRKVCFSPPDPEDLKQLTPSAAHNLALPFPGRFYTKPVRDYTALGAAFAIAGHNEVALRYLESAPQDSDKVLFAIGRIHFQAGRWAVARGYLSVA